MKNLKAFMKIFVLVLLIAVAALCLFSCEKDTVDQGTEITITVAVTNKVGETTEQEITTTATNLADALTGAGIASGTKDQYGLYITAVNGETADYSVDQSFWSITKNGEALFTGASSTKIANGEHYELTYTVYSE